MHPYPNVMMIAPRRPRRFDLEPAYAGKSVWDLDRDGPFAPTVAGNWTIVPRTTFRAFCKVWGAAAGRAGGAAMGLVRLRSGQAYSVFNGAPPSGRTGGLPGGGDGGFSGAAPNGQGGGGWSGIRVDGGPAKIIAGGAGGDAASGADGGAGGGLAGEAGQPGGGALGGQAGTQTVGTPFEGGDGQSGAYLANGGGGGGGGFRGGQGGGAAAGASASAGGGGGSGYLDPADVEDGELFVGAALEPGAASDPDRGDAGAIVGGTPRAGRTILF